MFAVSCVGLTLIATLLLLGWIRRNRASLPFGGSERTATRLVVVLGIATPIVLLSGLFVWSDVFVIRTTAAPSPRSIALTVHVVAHEWFWEIRFDDRASSTANELHIPVRTNVGVVGTTADVIHSLWVPELNRKIDLIPGHTNSVLLYADRAGTYLGQCSEFCGLQHAHMGMYVFADPPAVFRRWLAHESQPAPAAGAGLFVDKCGSCHTIRGTQATSRVGPDLTHVGSRRSLAAVTIPNRPARMREWLRDPQRVKPGSQMPEVPLSRAEIRSLVAYLEARK